MKFWVVGAGVSGKLGHESTQKVTMQLIPLGPDGQGPARIRNREQLVSETTLAIHLAGQNVRIIRRTTTQPIRNIKADRPRTVPSVS